MKHWVEALIVGIGSTIAMFGVFLCVAVYLDSAVRMDDEVALTGSFGLCGVVTVAIWLFAFRRHLLPRAWRLIYSIAALVGVTAASSIVGAFLAALVRRDEEVVIVGMTFVGLGVWIILIGAIWRLTPEERLAARRQAGRIQVRCVTCGYSMVGLREARCPECGRAYTLDELIAGQVYAPAPPATAD
jgi:hypothetical protein